MKRPHKDSRPKLSKSQQMARVRSKDTGLEMRLRRALWAAGLRYRIRPALPGTPDVAFPRARVAIFMDGCFWHGCPEHYTAPAANADFWQRKLERNIHRDAWVIEELSALGWTSLRIWEHEISADLGAVVARVATKVRGVKAM